MTIEGSGLGVHRSIDPTGVLPQTAWRLDNRPQLWPIEARLEVEVLALDSVVLRRLRDAVAGDRGKLRASLLEMVAERSKLQDPDTGAGGTLLGRVTELGSDCPHDLRVGARVALPSALGLTPLWLTDVAAGDGASTLVTANGHAIVFPRSPLARIPHDLDARLALNVIEVAAVVSVVRRRVRRGDKVAVLGGASPAGALASVAARERGASRVVSVVTGWREACLVGSLGAATPAVADLRNPLATAAAVREGLDGFSDLAVVCDDVEGVEGGALLATRPGGTALFVASRLTCAGLADVSRCLSSDVELVVASGHVSGAAEDAFELLTTYPALRTLVSKGRGPAFDSWPTLADHRDAAAGGGKAGQIRDAAAGGGRAGQHA